MAFDISESSKAKKKKKREKLKISDREIVEIINCQKVYYVSIPLPKMLLAKVEDRGDTTFHLPTNLSSPSMNGVYHNFYV